MKTKYYHCRSKQLSSGFLVFTLSVVILSWCQPAWGQLKANWKERWDNVLNGAKTEGKVVVWASAGSAMRKAIVDGFTKAYPEITIEFTGGRSSTLASKLRTERENGVFSVDVMLGGTTTAIVQLKPIHALLPIEPLLLLPEVADLKNWRGHALQFGDKEGRYNLVAFEIVYHPVFYNIDQVKPGDIQNLDDLLDPKWKGRIVLNDPIAPGPAYPTFRWIWNLLGPSRATEYYKGIKAQVATIDRDARRMIEAVANGKYAIALAPNNSYAQDFLKRGLKFGVLPDFKDVGGFVSAGGGSLMPLTKAPHPNAQVVFVNWILTREGQTAWGKSINYPSLRLDVPKDYLTPNSVAEPGARYWTKQFKPGDRYWVSHFEENLKRSPEEEKILRELFRK
jgi:iron(III) transport system substrate-binding protein